MKFDYMNDYMEEKYHHHDHDEHHHSHEHEHGGHEHEHGEGEEGEIKKTIIKIVVSALLLVGIYFVPLDETIKMFLYLVPYAICGYETVWLAITGLLRGGFMDETFLMTIASAGAFIVGQYPEAVFVMLFYQVGELFEDVAVDKSRDSITDLMDLKVEHAHLIQGEQELDIDAEDIKAGDLILVKPGEKIPVDGNVEKGESSINAMALTGESLPKAVGVGDVVYSGSINMDGNLYIKATSTMNESTAVKILELVEEAEERKAKAENFITRFARVYTPIVVSLAVLLALGGTLFIGDANTWIYRGLLFLVVSCPCALVISIPLAFFAGLGGVSRKGVLVKGSNYLELLGKIDTMVFDKTGTLTEGKFRIKAINPIGISEEQLLALAANIEVDSNHPLALSIKEAYGKEIQRRGELKDLPGLGVEATIEGEKYYAGRGMLLEEKGIQYDKNEDMGTTIYVANSSSCLGSIVLRDTIKEDTKSALASLKKLGIKSLVCLTGDKKEVGDEIGKELGLEVRSELMPQDKLSELEKLLDKGTVAYVGDGINDAPVLARADLGIAMGAMGQDAAIEAADVVLMEDKLSKLPFAIRLSRKAKRIVWGNIAFSILVKLVVMVLGALGIANMWMAVFADVGVCVIAVANSMRALRCK